MLVFVNTNQLWHIIEKAVRDTLRIEPENLTVEQKHLTRNEGIWDVEAEFDQEGRHHRLKLLLEPSTGHIIKIEVHRYPNVFSGEAYGG